MAAADFDPATQSVVIPEPEPATPDPRVEELTAEVEALRRQLEELSRSAVSAAEEKAAEEKAAETHNTEAEPPAFEYGMPEDRRAALGKINAGLRQRPGDVALLALKKDLERLERTDAEDYAVRFNAAARQREALLLEASQFQAKGDWAQARRFWVEALSLSPAPESWTNQAAMQIESIDRGLAFSQTRMAAEAERANRGRIAALAWTAIGAALLGVFYIALALAARASRPGRPVG